MEIISMISQSMKSGSMKSVSMAGKTDGEWFEGYPLEVLAKAKKTASAYTIFGNTNSSAKGVGEKIVKNSNGTYSYNGQTLTEQQLCTALGYSSIPSLPFGSTYHLGVVDTVNTPNFSPKKSALFLTQPLNKIGELVDSVDNKGKEYHPLKVVDMGSFTYEKKTHASGRVYFIFTPTDRDSGSGKTANTILQCGSYTSASSFYIADCPDDCVGCNGSNKICWVIDADFTDKTADEVKTLLTGTKLVYALDTPTTATAVSVGKIGVQKGDNVITTDTEVKPTKIKAKI